MKRWIGATGLGLFAAVMLWIGGSMAPVPDLAWVRFSGEYPRLCRQIYRAAAERLPEAVRDRAGPWAVVMDIDETCLSTAEYRARKRHSLPLWPVPSFSNWCARGGATAVPGAAEFTRTVRSLGGKVILISDRAESLRVPTEGNLKREGIEYDGLLLKSGGETKSERRRKAEEGSALPGLGPLTIVMIVGDRMEDFPSGPGEESGEWGSRWILLPNPMYGSWLKKF